MAPQRPGRTKVLIVGGGAVGLLVYSLLSQSRIENCVVERHAETQSAPRRLFHCAAGVPYAVFFSSCCRSLSPTAGAFNATY